MQSGSRGGVEACYNADSRSDTNLPLIIVNMYLCTNVIVNMCKLLGEVNEKEINIVSFV